MRASVQASLSRLGFYEQTLCLHMGCIISTSPLWESAAINASAPRRDKPLPSACICIGYQLCGCNNRIGHRLTCIRRKPSRAIIKENVSVLQPHNYIQSILWQSFCENVTAITFNTVVKTKWGDHSSPKTHENIHIRGLADLTFPSALLSGTAGRSSELGEHP